MASFPAIRIGPHRRAVKPSAFTTYPEALELRGWKSQFTEAVGEGTVGLCSTWRRIPGRRLRMAISIGADMCPWDTANTPILPDRSTVTTRAEWLSAIPTT